MTTAEKIKTKASSPGGLQQQQLMIVIGIVAAAVIAAGVFIALSSADRVTVGEVSYDAIPQSRTPDGGFVLGDPDAPITIVEYADFFCPHCQNYHSTVSRFINEFVVTGMAKFEYRFLPTRSSQYSTFAAQVAECVEEQETGNFWRAFDLMFDYASGAGADENIGRYISDRLGLDYGAVLECTTTATQHQTDQRSANALEITGTPAIRVRIGDSQPQLIGQQYTSGSVPFETLESLVLSAQMNQ